MKSREQKRAEAKERNERWNMLSIGDKLAYLAMRPGKCTKQRNKILAKIS